MLAPQPGLDCCTSAPGVCFLSTSHSTSVYTWSGSGALPSPSIALYVRSSVGPSLLLTPPSPNKPLNLPANAESVVLVISDGAPHSWIIQSGGDVLVSGMHYTCQPEAEASDDIPCSSQDAIAVLPLPVGLGRRASIAMHVSVSVDYGNGAGLADFGVADDDDDNGVDENFNDEVSSKRTVQNTATAGLQFERVGNGPASALQVCRISHQFVSFAIAFLLKNID